jgi:RNA polymerase sigma-54 factor
MIRQSQIHALRPLTTAHLAQTMTLLGLSTFELREKIEAALSSNPALELIGERRCPICKRRLVNTQLCPVCSQPAYSPDSEPIVFVSPREDFYTYSSNGSSRVEEGDHSTEWIQAAEDLPVYVLRQIAPDLDEKDRPLAAHILTSLDDDGLLQVPLAEIARYHHVLISRVQAVLNIIQRADPLGVGSPNPQEALLVQLSILAETRPVPPLAARTIQEGMDLLSRRAFPELARRLGSTQREVQTIARFISENLNPFPARSHWGESHEPNELGTAYHTPDIVISCLNDAPDSRLVVEVASPYSGSLRVNALFREALAYAPAEKNEEWQAALNQATLLVKCIQQRDNTLVRLMQRLSVLQREFILKGDAFLTPITRASLADDLEVHESTISRAVSGKAVQLPNRRIVPLSKLFDRSLSVRTALRSIIHTEAHPLSDSQICERLKEQGFDVARRTVAKYRAMEGILPARYRQPASMTRC